MEVNEFVLNEWQDAFVFSDKRFVALFNEFGSGKTSAGIIKSWLLLEEYANNFGVVIRNFRDDLRNATIPQYFELIFGIRNYIPPDVGWNKTNNLLTLSNGSQLKFMALDRPEDATKLKNLVIGFFWIEQAEEIPEEVFTMLQGRLRLKSVPHYGFITGNPEGGDHWIKKTFYSHPLNVTVEEIDGINVQYGFWGKNDSLGITARPLSNEKNLPEGYYKGLKETFPREWQIKYIYSMWTGLSGLVYPFEDDNIVYENEQFSLNDLPKYSIVAYAQDYGISDTSPMVWLTLVKHDGTYYVVDEYYEYEKGIDDVCNYVKSLNAIHMKQPLFTVGCPRTFQKEGTSGGRKPVHLFRQNGINIDKHAVPFETRQPVLAKLIETKKFKIFSNCENTIKEFRSYKWKNFKTADNHAIEAIERAIHRFEYSPQRFRKSYI
jgi:PBSX family phage terminase large subunit